MKKTRKAKSPYMNSIMEKVLKAVEERKAEIIELTQKLVKTPSENTPPYGNELACQKMIHEFFKKAGIKAEFVYPEKVGGLKEHKAYLSGRNYENRPNVTAVYKGSGRKGSGSIYPSRGKSLLFSGHIDTVPVGMGKWKHDPLSADIEGGKLFGRGSYDMKAGLACMMMCVCILKDMGIELNGDLLFESVVDEEHAGCNGTLANRLFGHNADAAILAEPSNLDIYPAHKGFRIIHLTVKGSSGMSFAGESIENPVEHIGRLIECIKEFKEKRRRDTNIPPIYSEDNDPVPVFMPKLQAGEFSYRIPMSIPDTCKLEVYWQTMPGENREDVEQEFFEFLNAWCKNDAFFSHNPPEWEFSHRWLPGTQISKDHPIVTTAKNITEEITHQAVNIKGAPYPCDLFIFNLYANMPGIVLGPRGGNAHGEDEFVLVEDLINLTKVFSSIAIEWCGTGSNIL